MLHGQDGMAGMMLHQCQTCLLELQPPVLAAARLMFSKDSMAYATTHAVAGKH